MTAFFAATIAMVQTDIKRVLAYSTISQLGYMFLGVGVGAFAAGIFHLMTHAFFKGLLFLCAGSVIHALDGEQDMNKMGALWRQMPITYATMLVGDARDQRDARLLRLLLQRPHPGTRLRRGPSRALADRRHHRRPHRVLHVPADLHDLSRKLAGRARQGLTSTNRRR